MNSSFYTWIGVFCFLLFGGFSEAQTNSKEDTSGETKVEVESWIDYDSLYSKFFSKLDTSTFSTDSFSSFPNNFNLEGVLDSNEVYKEIIKSIEGMNEAFGQFFEENQTIDEIDKILKEQFQGFLDKDSIDQYDEVIKEQIKIFSDFFNNEEDSLIAPQ